MAGWIRWLVIAGSFLAVIPGTAQPEPDGKSLYIRHCLVCHQADGSGVPGMFPPLTGPENVRTSADSLIRMVIYGISRPLDVQGVVYNQPMPGLPYLKDEEIAAILNYIRNSWGNKAPVITVKVVARVRSSGSKPK